MRHDCNILPSDGPTRQSVRSQMKGAVDADYNLQIVGGLGICVLFVCAARIELDLLPLHCCAFVLGVSAAFCAWSCDGRASLGSLRRFPSRFPVVFCSQ